MSLHKGKRISLPVVCPALESKVHSSCNGALFHKDANCWQQLACVARNSFSSILRRGSVSWGTDLQNLAGGGLLFGRLCLEKLVEHLHVALGMPVTCGASQQITSTTNRAELMTCDSTDGSASVRRNTGRPRPDAHHVIVDLRLVRDQACAAKATKYILPLLLQLLARPAQSCPKASKSHQRTARLFAAGKHRLRAP